MLWGLLALTLLCGAASYPAQLHSLHAQIDASHRLLRASTAQRALLLAKRSALFPGQHTQQRSEPPALPTRRAVLLARHATLSGCVACGSAGCLLVSLSPPSSLAVHTEGGLQIARHNTSLRGASSVACTAIQGGVLVLLTHSEGASCFRLRGTELQAVGGVELRGAASSSTALHEDSGTHRFVVGDADGRVNLISVQCTLLKQIPTPGPVHRIVVNALAPDLAAVSSARSVSLLRLGSGVVHACHKGPHVSSTALRTAGGKSFLYVGHAAGTLAVIQITRAHTRCSALTQYNTAAHVQLAPVGRAYLAVSGAGAATLFRVHNTGLQGCWQVPAMQHVATLLSEPQAAVVQVWGDGSHALILHDLSLIHI
eukprot:TRINITY_DN45138_c0_g1_i2.p1 TRINITY_DN45138_c0_g1~~TRINITY_DN45138_c0_g1_i2.p1  ORF type:complete len:370 (+),score=94.37 TRINITY_DN45138_c0_g1_i2:58-1167(+)